MSKENVDRFRAGIQAYNRVISSAGRRTSTRVRSSSLRSLHRRATTQGSLS